MPDLGINPAAYKNHYVDKVVRDVHTAISPPDGESAYVKNADISGCKNGIDFRPVSAGFVDGAKVRNVVPQTGGSSVAFGNGLFMKNSGTCYLRDLDIDSGLGLKNDQNSDCVGDDGQGNDGDDSFMGEWLYITRAHLRNPGETTFDCKRLNFVMHDSTLEGTAEELVKHWRASDGYYIGVVFDLRKVSSGVTFRLRGANGNKAKLHFFDCETIMPDGTVVKGLPPKSTISFESGMGGVYENSFILLNAVPAFIRDNPFFEFEAVPPVEPPVEPPLGAVTREEFAALESRVNLLEAKLTLAARVFTSNPE